MQIIIFESSDYSNLFPLSILRPIFNTPYGAFSPLEKIKLAVNKKDNISILCRDPIKNLLKKEFPRYKINDINQESSLFINGKANFKFKYLKKLIKEFPQDSILVENNIPIFANIGKSKIKKINYRLFFDNKIPNNLKVITNFENNDFVIINYAWEIIKFLDETLTDDLKVLFNFSKNNVLKVNDFSILNPDLIKLGKTTRVLPLSILDANEGNIFIDEGTIIEPFSYIKGPVYIGKCCTIKSGSRIYGPVSIGFMSKVSGEITGSVFHSYVNKQHDGFIGNTYACPFVNFGADTVTSNLKNNYSKVKVKFNNTNVDTKMQFLGSIIGDHTKLGVNTMLNTGTIIGIFANITGGGFPEKKIDSFSWYILGKKPQRYRIQEAIETAKSVMKRRNIKVTDEYVNYINYIYKNL